MNILIKLYVLFFGKKIATDEFGNKYYQLKSTKFGRVRRFVLYKGKVEASKVSSHWHAWLRNTSSTPIQPTKYFWQKTHKPNLTGTKYANLNNNTTNLNSYNNYTPWSDN